MHDAPLTLAVDLGGTRMRAGVVTEHEFADRVVGVDRPTRPAGSSIPSAVG